jgi:hypothetical protein
MLYLLHEISVRNVYIIRDGPFGAVVQCISFFVDFITFKISQAPKSVYEQIRGLQSNPMTFGKSHIVAVSQRSAMSRYIAECSRLFSWHKRNSFNHHTILLRALPREIHQLSLEKATTINGYLVVIFQSAAKSFKSEKHLLSLGLHMYCICTMYV